MTLSPCRTLQNVIQTQKCVLCLEYEDATTTVRVNGRESKAFSVRVGVHQGSVLSPLLFIIVLEALSREFREGLPMELLYADDLVLVAETEELLMGKLRKWKRGMELKCLRVRQRL